MATLLNSISLLRSWLPIFVIALKSAPVYTLNVYTPTDLHGMAPSAQTPGAESGPARKIIPRDPFFTSRRYVYDAVYVIDR